MVDESAPEAPGPEARPPSAGTAVVRGLAIGVGVLVVIAALVAIATPLLIPLLPQRVQVALSPTIHTVPGTVDELLSAAHIGPYAVPGEKTTHEQADAEYVLAATIWPWTLPPDWGFPENRGIRDDPGRHWRGMGVQAAFSMWAQASLQAVEGGQLDPAEANALLDDVEDATRTLLDADVLSDTSFIADSITPLRQQRERGLV